MHTGKSYWHWTWTAPLTPLTIRRNQLLRFPPTIFFPFFVALCPTACKNALSINGTNFPEYGSRIHRTVGSPGIIMSLIHFASYGSLMKFPVFSSCTQCVVPHDVWVITHFNFSFFFFIIPANVAAEIVVLNVAILSRVFKRELRSAYKCSSYVIHFGFEWWKLLNRLQSVLETASQVLTCFAWRTVMMPGD